MHAVKWEPFDHHALGREAVDHRAEVLDRVEVGAARHRRMDRIGGHDVERGRAVEDRLAPVGEVESRALRHAAPRRGEALRRLRDLRLQFVDVDRPRPMARDRLRREAPAEPDDRDARGTVRPRLEQRHGEVAEERQVEHVGRPRRRLETPLDPELEPAVAVARDHRRGAAVARDERHAVGRNVRAGRIERADRVDARRVGEGDQERRDEHRGAAERKRRACAAREREAAREEERARAREERPRGARRRDDDERGEEPARGAPQRVRGDEASGAAPRVCRSGSAARTNHGRSAAPKRNPGAASTPTAAARSPSASHRWP